MNKRCEVCVGRFVSPEDYEACGKPAWFKVEDGTWMCADHYDEHVQMTARIYNGDASGEL